MRAVFGLDFRSTAISTEIFEKNTGQHLKTQGPKFRLLNLYLALQCAEHSGFDPRKHLRIPINFKTRSGLLFTLPKELNSNT